MTVKCFKCGWEGKKLSSHWAMSKSCDFPPLNQKQREVIIGCLLGDGCMQNPQGDRNSRLIVTNNHRRFLEWLLEELEWLGSKVGKAKEAFAEWQAWTMNHPELNEFREWYSSGQKVFPEDFEMTPTITKVWYAGDGTRCFNKTGSSFARISNIDQSSQMGVMAKKFRKRGIEARDDGRGQLTFTGNADKKLLDWMGEPVPGYEYKWAKSKVEYDQLLNNRKGNSLLEIGE